MPDSRQGRDDEPIGNDLIRGARAIAAELNETERRTQYLLETGQIPAGKSGRVWIASRRRLREHYQALTNGRAA
jgi:hypothetical protein